MQVEQPKKTAKYLVFSDLFSFLYFFKTSLGKYVIPLKNADFNRKKAIVTHQNIHSLIVALLVPVDVQKTKNPNTRFGLFPFVFGG